MSELEKKALEWWLSHSAREQFPSVLFNGNENIVKCLAAFASSLSPGDRPALGLPDAEPSVPLSEAPLRSGPADQASPIGKPTLADVSKDEYDAAYDIVQRYKEQKDERRRALIALPCPCCSGETNDSGDCNPCEVMFLNGSHQAQDCDKWHTHGNRCMIPITLFMERHPGTTPRELVLERLRANWKAQQQTPSTNTDK